MKMPLFRWQPLLAATLLTLAFALPARAARLRRLPAYQTETFLVASNATIAVGTNHSASLGDLKVGDQANIGYVQENGSLVARRIADGVPRKPRNPSTSPAPKPHHSAGAPVLSHIHGVIQAVDLQANTVTIAHRLR